MGLLVGLSCLNSLEPGLDFGNGGGHIAFGDFSIVGRLGAEPISIGEAKESAKAQIGIWGDGAFAGDDLSDALGRNTTFLGESVLADPHWLEEFFEEQFSGGNGFEL